MEHWDRDAETRNPRRCQGCGAHVSETFRRGYGTDGMVYACPSCTINRELEDSAGDLE